MAEAATPDASVNKWLIEDGDALNVAHLDVRLLRRTEIDGARKTLFEYRQYLAGLPVEGAVLNITTLNSSTSQVVAVAGFLCSPPNADLGAPKLSASDAWSRILARPESIGLTKQGQPELVILFHPDDGIEFPGSKAWRMSGLRMNADRPQAFTYFVDASSGEILYVRNDINNSGINVHVDGLITPGVLPDVAYNSASAGALGYLYVVDILQDGCNSGSITLDRFGNGQFLPDGCQTYDLRVRCEGVWARITSNGSPALETVTHAVSPGPVSIVANSAQDELQKAQVNAYTHLMQLHNFFKDYQAQFNVLDTQAQCTVNGTGICNAEQLGNLLLFYRSIPGCANSAYSSIIAHEYGHFVLFRRQLVAGGAFGEGFGDSLALLYCNDTVVGRDFFGPSQPVRDIVTANQQHPCSSSDSHICGQVLAGVWLDLRNLMQNAYGTDAGLDRVRQLFIRWAISTRVGVGSPQGPGYWDSAIDDLRTADDDNGNLNDGTPNEAFIGAALIRHNLWLDNGIRDCNHNGVDDFLEVDHGNRADCNLNGVLDECESNLTMLQFNSAATGCENGSQQFPYHSVTSARQSAPDGATLLLPPGSYQGPGIYNRPLRIQCTTPNSVARIVP